MARAVHVLFTLPQPCARWCSTFGSAAGVPPSAGCNCSALLQRGSSVTARLSTARSSSRRHPRLTTMRFRFLPALPLFAIWDSSESEMVVWELGWGSMIDLCVSAQGPHGCCAGSSSTRSVRDAVPGPVPSPICGGAICKQALHSSVPLGFADVLGMIGTCGDGGRALNTACAF